MADAALTSLAEAANEEFTTEKWRAILENLGDVHRSVTCAHCHRTNRVPVPNVDAIVKVLDRAFGKPAESKTVEVIASGSVTVLHELSDEQLRAIADGAAVIEEGEWTTIASPPEPPLLPAA